MDIPVEATVHLNVFHNKAEVREILRAHDFQLRDLSSDRVLVKGSFSKLKAAKASLEQLLHSQAKAYITPPPQASSGAISKYYRSSSLTRSNKVQDKPLYGSLPTRSSSRSPKKHPENRGSLSSRPEQRGSISYGRECFVVDADVFVYADRLRNKDIKGILHSYGVTKEEHQVGDSFNVIVLGENAKMAASKLQNLLNDLSKSLRTQEVHLKEMGWEGRALYERIQSNNNIQDSVLIFRTHDSLHLIGPSTESYELKMRLLEGRREKSIFRSFRRNRGSQPRIHQKNKAKDDTAIAGPDPGGAAGYSPPNHQSYKVAEPERGNFFTRKFSLRGRNSSETRKKHQEERDHKQEVARNHQPPKSAKTFFKQLFSFKNIDKKMWRKSSKKDK